jgi:hypothetical protein
MLTAEVLQHLPMEDVYLLQDRELAFLHQWVRLMPRNLEVKNPEFLSIQKRFPMMCDLSWYEKKTPSLCEEFKYKFTAEELCLTSLRLIINAVRCNPTTYILDPLRLSLFGKSCTPSAFLDLKVSETTKEIVFVELRSSRVLVPQTPIEIRLLEDLSCDSLSGRRTRLWDELRFECNCLVCWYQKSHENLDEFSALTPSMILIEQQRDYISFCANCGKSQYNYPCSSCTLVHYCSSVCQSQHWKESHHSRCLGVKSTLQKLFRYHVKGLFPSELSLWNLKDQAEYAEKKKKQHQSKKRLLTEETLDVPMQTADHTQ